MGRFLDRKSVVIYLKVSGSQNENRKSKCSENINLMFFLGRIFITIQDLIFNVVTEKALEYRQGFHAEKLSIILQKVKNY